MPEKELTLIGEPSSAAALTLDSWQAPQRQDQAESVWVESGLANRPEIQAAAWELAALGDDAELTKLAPFDGTDLGVKAEHGPGE